MVIGPFVGLTVFINYNITILFWTATGASLLALILSWTANPPEEEKTVLNAHTPKEQTIFEKSAVPIALIAAYLVIAYSSLLSFLAVFANDIGLEAVSSYFFTVYAFVLLLSRPFTGRWFDQYGANVIIFPAIILFSIGMFSLGHSTGVF